MKKMKRLGYFTALFFTVLFIHPLQAQMQVDKAATPNVYDKNRDDSKHVLIVDIRLSPIPAKDILNLQFKTQQATSIHIQINNIMGRVIHEVRATTNSGLHTHTFDIANFPRGTYFLSIGTGQHTQTKRFVKR